MYHGLGERLLGDLASTAQLIELIDRLIGDPKYKQAAARMRAQFRADGNDTVGLRFVTDVMEGRIQPVTAAHYAEVTRRLFRGIMGQD